MPSMHVSVERYSVISAAPFETVVDRLSEAVGRPDVPAFLHQLSLAADAAELDILVRSASGDRDFLQFARFDYSTALDPKFGIAATKCQRFIIGNPIIMQGMARHVPDAASYAPVTLLVVEREDGVHVSYDTMASLLAPYGSREASDAAAKLDDKVRALMRLIAG